MGNNGTRLDSTAIQLDVPLELAFLDYAFMWLIGVFDAVLELIVLSGQEQRDLIVTGSRVAKRRRVPYALSNLEFMAAHVLFLTKSEPPSARNLCYRRQREDVSFNFKLPFNDGFASTPYKLPRERKRSRSRFWFGNSHGMLVCQ
jgi:hypothetical protein